MKISIAIHGASGRMGRRLVALCQEDPDLRLVAALEREGHSQLGQDAGTVAGVEPAGTTLTGQLSDRPDVLVDFTMPPAMGQILRTCVEQHIAVVIGTTGLTDRDHAAIDQAAKTIPVLQSPNMSLGVNLMFALAAQVARRLGDDYDIEITEAHHRFKVDAPSGTAMGIAGAICEATGKDLNTDVVYGRHGPDTPRRRGQIGMHALRLGDVVGEHTARYATLGECLQLKHTATNRDIFARGALRAAKWLVDQPPRRYSMKDVLGL